MGKIDDMRRQREQQFADADERRTKAAKVAKASAVVEAPAPSAPSSPAASPAASPLAAPSPSPRPRPKTKGATDEQGKCPDCGKTKPLQNGVMASHQKGFGKACTGSRKAPV